MQTDKGNLRKTNEDSMLRMDLWDSIWWQTAEVTIPAGCQWLAVELMKDPLLSSAGWRREQDLPGFNRCLWHINEEIYRRASADGENTGMATTAVMLLLRRKSLYIQCGRQSCYLYRKGLSITEDHTYVNELLKSGQQ